MTDMMFIGGAPYSGKTTLCDVLVEARPDKYVGFELDKYYDVVENSPRDFFTNIAITNSNLLDLVGADLSMSEPQLGLAYIDLKERIVFGNSPRHWIMMLQLAANLALTQDLLKIDEDQVPVYVSLMYNKAERQTGYQAMVEYLSIVEELTGKTHPKFNPQRIDSLRKTFAFLDISPAECIRRYQANPDLKPISGEAEIRHAYAIEEHPTIDEWPNLEVVIIKNDVELEAFVEQAQLIS